MDSNEINTIREYSPLTFLNDIPTNINRGIFSVDLNITCVDAMEEFIALGTNAGIIFWYNRQTEEVKKLKVYEPFEMLKTPARMTCVKICDTVEFLVAVGDSSGRVVVFGIPKEAPPNVVAPFTKPKPMVRYTITDMHKSAISCCEWAKNGMKLFTGNEKGEVVLSELDHQTRNCQSTEILSEGYKIVQLSTDNGYLLVSTLYRSIVCHRNPKFSSNNWIVKQIGKKDRQQLATCGGTIFKQSLLPKNKKLRLICGRPNLRLWLADTGGNVEKTLLFHKAIAESSIYEIPILNPVQNASSVGSAAQGDGESAAVGGARNFRNIYSYAGTENLIVTRDERALYILNIESLTVEAVATRFRRIIDFSVCNKEIFVLEGERSLVRLAPTLDKPNKTDKIIYNASMAPPLPVMGSSMYNYFEAPVEYESQNLHIIKGEECFDLLDTEIPIALAVESPKSEQNRRLEVFKEISEMEYDKNILHHSAKSKNASRKKDQNKSDTSTNIKKPKEGIVEIGHAALQAEKVKFRFDNAKINANISTDRTKGSNSDSTKEVFTEVSLQSTTNEESGPSKYLAQTILQQPQLSYPKGTDYKTIMQDAIKPTTEEKLKKSFAQPLSIETSQQDFSKMNMAEIKKYAEAAYFKKFLTDTLSPDPSLQLSPLGTISPIENISKNISIQTTPHKKLYHTEEQLITDFTDGQPIEDVCHTLRAINRIETERGDEPKTNEPQKLIDTQTKNYDDIDSFVMDFEIAGEPLSSSDANRNVSSTSTKPENESSTSPTSEFEIITFDDLL